MMYLAENVSKLRYIGVSDKCKIIRMNFYIKCCVVIDKHLENIKAKKKDFYRDDNIIERLYYERDKNSAHKDDEYQGADYDSLSRIAEEMKTQLQHVFDRCRSSLPDNITLDFVSHDKEMFRFVHRITDEQEDEINERKYPMAQKYSPNSSEGKTFKIFSDPEDIKKISKEKQEEYCVIFRNGICFNEGIQERQDSCIAMNVIYDTNTWCSLNREEYDRVMKLAELGLLNEFGEMQPLPKDPIILARITELLEQE